MSVDSRVKFLIKKLARLEDEYINSNSIFQEGSAEVEKLFRKEYQIEDPETSPPTESGKTEEVSPPDPIESENEREPTESQVDEQEEAETHVDPEVKKLYRKIATKAHPDKLVNMPEGKEKEKLKGIFQNATRFMENNDYASLAAIAIVLDIEVQEFSENDLKKVKERISIIKDKIHKIEKTVIWKWIFEENKEVKDKLLKALFKYMYDKKNKPHPRP